MTNLWIRYKVFSHASTKKPPIKISSLITLTCNKCFAGLLQQTSSFAAALEI